MLDYLRVKNCPDKPVGHRTGSALAIDYLSRLVVNGVSNEQDAEAVVKGVLVRSAIGNADLAIGLDIDVQILHISSQEFGAQQLL